MPESFGAPESSERIRVGDVSGTMIVGSHNTVNNLNITAQYGSKVTLHAGPLPKPVKRDLISHLPRSGAEPLIGRDHDLQLLQQVLQTRQLVQLWGDPGVGKSALLRHLAHTAPGGPEGAAYIEAGGRTADDLAQAIFDISFDAPNYKPSLEVLKEHLKTLRLRIYLDDAGLDEKDLHRLFDMAEHSSFVFTSQKHCAVNGVHAVRLDGLTAPAGAKLVQAVLARGLLADETRTVQALCDAVQGNPLRLRRIALSASTGKGLPSIADLPELLPALLNRLQPAERDLLHLLGSLSGAELAARQLDALLGRPDCDTIAGGLVRHGLLVASETGYGCPPDVAECVLKSRGTQYPAKLLCQALTAWVEARETTPDEVAALFQALDVAVVRAERSGQPELGVALARAASPKLALSRQFDAWGSLLGAGWAAARSAGDSAGEAFFLGEARTRRRAIGRAALTTALVLEADVLWHELAALHAHSAAAHQAATAAASHAAATHAAATAAASHATATHAAATAITPPVHTFVAPHSVATLPPVPHLPAVPVAPHAPVLKPVINLSQAGPHPTAAAHLSGAHAAASAPTPPRIDLSQAHTTAGHPAHAVGAHTTAGHPAHAVGAHTAAGHSAHTAGMHAGAAGTGHTAHLSAHAAGTAATGTGHTALTTAGAAGAKGGISALAISCTFGVVVVVGVGAAVYANDQPKAVDPVCATVASSLATSGEQMSADHASVTTALDSYNAAMAAYNSGQTSTPPDKSALNSGVDSVITDLNSFESALREGISQAQDASVKSDLNRMLVPTQQLESLYQSYKNNSESAGFTAPSQGSALVSAMNSLQTDCGG
ncbi:hypothetical protein C7C46_01755 [Streptomyces tateyamensis]|uniref:Uncharacterized protein n=1 Tax=Streptomyces tateyamensis TaxID=565073 RepID=A0A2V4PSJ0_9ACTN|nr:ATP-binding protein [Streptomyces tateyamensis]PYC88022.1 hypothetical protein C7C46_01755 [Streptomyces tateyamensis]